MASDMFTDGWSSTAGSNTAADGVSVTTGMSPALVDNALRAIMSVVRASFASGLANFFKGSSALPVANGGTGVTSLSGILAAIGGLEDDYRDLIITTKTGAFTFADTDRAGGINYTGAVAAATINPNATTAITAGAVIVIRNNGSGALTITPGSGVSLKKNGATSSATAILAVGGQCSLIRWATDDWTVNGSGVS